MASFARSSSRSRARCGTAATEFAVVAPLVLLLALASADFGRAFHVREAISNAARVGAMTAATRGVTPYTAAAWEEEVRAAIRAEMENLPGFDEGELAVSVDVSGTEDAEGLFLTVVEVVYPFRTAIAWPGLPPQITIRERIAMRRFR